MVRNNGSIVKYCIAIKEVCNLNIIKIGFIFEIENGTNAKLYLLIYYIFFIIVI